MIESLHSPHVARVKALIGSKGAKERRDSGLFVAEGIQAAREALGAHEGPIVQSIYFTAEGSEKIADLDFSNVDSFEVTNAVMEAMTSTVTPQGVLAICEIPEISLKDFKPASKNPLFIYLHEIQDPGNAGTILRSADANGFDAVITSANSVDFYSPKVVRSTAGSLWHIPVFQGIPLQEVVDQFHASQPLLLSSHATSSITECNPESSYIAIFGNEARGVSISDLGLTSAFKSGIKEVTIPMAGRAESLNLSAAASIVMFQLSSGRAG